MVNHPEQETLTSFRSHRLSGDEVVRVAEHVRECERCSALLREPHAGATLAEGLLFESNGHLTESEVDALVAGTASPGLRLSSAQHLSGCAMCSEDVADLRAFSSRRADTPRFRWLAAVAATLLVAFGIGSFLSSRTTEAPEESVVTVPPPARVAIKTDRLTATPMAMRDGRVVIGADGSIDGLTFANGADAELARQAVTGGAIPRAAILSQLTSVATISRGPTQSNVFDVLEPRGVVVRSLQPRFVWTPQPGITQYRVSVFTDDFVLVQESPVVNATEWTPTRSLPRGQNLTWQVTAIGDGRETIAPSPQSGEARFHVLGEASDQKLRAEESRYAGSDLMLGLIYARAGLMIEAEKALAAFAWKNRDAARAQELYRAIRQQKNVTR